MLETIRGWLAIPLIHAGVIVVIAVVVAIIIERTIHRAFTALAKKTKTDLDDKIIAILRRPIFVSAISLGMHYGSRALDKQLVGGPRRYVYGVIITLVVVFWTTAVMRSGSLVLTAMSRRSRPGSLLQESSLPLFDILFKIAAVGSAIYLGFLAWDMDLTAWLASAGILGVALGFGAKDTLANLFAGIFIIADAPYKLGDFVVLDESLRGRVTSIGIRSTRILTLDDIEVTVPNGVIGNGRIINETGGPDIRQRIRVPVSVAYGSDIDRVREVLLGCVDGVEDITASPKPQVQFVNFGASGLDFVLMVWINRPDVRDVVKDRLNVRIYKALAKADIEIPYNKLDVYVKETAASRDAA
jgi:small-conductance mechanosensitive channel